MSWLTERWTMAVNDESPGSRSCGIHFIRPSIQPKLLRIELFDGTAENDKKTFLGWSNTSSIIAQGK